jgi:hypothetical protein
MFTTKVSFEEFGQRATEISDSINQVLMITDRKNSQELETIWGYLENLPHAERWNSEDIRLVNMIENHRKAIEVNYSEIEALTRMIKQRARNKENSFFVQRSYLKLGSALLELRYYNIQFLVMQVQARIRQRLKQEQKNPT